MGPALHTERRFWYLHHEYGAPPKTLVCYAHEPHVYEEIVLSRILPLCSASSLDALQSQYLPDSCHFVMLVEPPPTSRFEPVKRFASRRIVDMFWDKRLGFLVEDLRFRSLGKAELIALLWLRRFSLRALGVPEALHERGTIE